MKYLDVIYKLILYYFFSGVWEKSGETINEQPQGTVNGLVEGNEYQFRVIAVNKSGQSEPSRPCANFIAKPRYCKFIN